MAGGLFNNGSGPSVIDVPALFDSDIPGEIARLVSMGVLVAIGTTRDRGALSFTITHDGAWDREYVRTSEEARDYLGRAAAALRAMGVGTEIPEPPGRPLATRRRQKLT
jgi:hypothetical protein